MQKRLFLLLALAGFAGSSYAQEAHRSCGAAQVLSYLEKNAPELAAKIQNPPQPAVNTASKGAENIVTVPVVFHIVLTGAQQNQLNLGSSSVLARVEAQIAVLNRDFAGANADSTIIPAVFKPFFGHSNLRFGLAHTDPNGNGTPGYEIVTTINTGFDVASGTAGSQFGFSDAAFTSAGGADPWDNNRYLNIWVIKMLEGGSTSSILGLSKGPHTIGGGGFSAQEEGVYLNYGAFGVKTQNGQYFISGINGGRTAVHEVGHFFRLNHIWGNSESGCTGDDGVGDTPLQDDATFGCPSGTQVSCSNASDGGDMYMNYMDYVDDVCMAMFTNGQVAVMTAESTTGGDSYNLTIHPELLQYPASVGTLSYTDSRIAISPNPATSVVSVSFPQDVELTEFSVTNSMGAVIATGAPVAGAGSATIDLAGMARGMYFLRCRTARGVSSHKILLR